MAILKKSTAWNRAFLMVQTSDHLSGLTGATVTCNISKNGAAFGAAGGAVTEIANGWYYVALNTTDTGTAGDLAYHCTATSGDATDFADQVWDSTVASVGVNAVTWVGGTIPAVNVTGVPLVDLKYTLGTISPAAAGSVSPDWGQVVNKTTTNVLSGTTIGTLTTYTGNTPQTGDAYAAITAGVSVTSNVKKNAALNGFTFVLTDSTTHNPKTGVTVTAQRSINGGALGSCTNAVTEISNGLYTINLSASDLNGNVILLRFTGTSTDDRDILIITQP